MHDTVFAILLRGSPPQIACGVVCRVAIQMTNVSAVMGCRAMENVRHNPVNGHPYPAPVFIKKAYSFVDPGTSMTWRIASLG